MSETPRTVSFYGTDGSGKSSIARAMMAPEDSPYALIGGSSYKTWLTDEVARLTLGPGHRLNEYSSDATDTLSLYEDIAVACYGLANYLRSRGQSALIDSDPYTKRIIWASVDNKALDVAYANRFERKMSDYIGAETAPDHIVAINMQGESSDQELFQRLQLRADNSFCDPVEIGEMVALNDQVKSVWRQVELGKKGLSILPGFNTRFAGATITHVENPHCEPKDIALQSSTLANAIEHQIAGYTT